MGINGINEDSFIEIFGAVRKATTTGLTTSKPTTLMSREKLEMLPILLLLIHTETSPLSLGKIWSHDYFYENGTRKKSKRTNGKLFRIAQDDFDN